MIRPSYYRTFFLMAMMAVPIPAGALTSIEPRNTNAVVAEQQRFIQFYEAEQSFQAKLKVGRERYNQKQINRDKIIEAMSSELQARQQTVVVEPVAETDGMGAPLGWIFSSLAVAALAVSFAGLRYYSNRQLTEDPLTQEKELMREPEAPVVVRKMADETFFCRGEGADARGQYTKEGFVVLKGSIGSAPSIIDKSIGPLLFTLLDSGVMRQERDKVVFETDHLFPTPSIAAMALMGRTANGWLEWTTEDGITLDTVERHESKG